MLCALSAVVLHRHCIHYHFKRCFSFRTALLCAEVFLCCLYAVYCRYTQCNKHTSHNTQTADHRHQRQQCTELHDQRVLGPTLTTALSSIATGKPITRASLIQPVLIATGQSAVMI